MSPRPSTREAGRYASRPNPPRHTARTDGENGRADAERHGDGKGERDEISGEQDRTELEGDEAACESGEAIRRDETRDSEISEEVSLLASIAYLTPCCVRSVCLPETVYTACYNRVSCDWKQTIG